MKSKSALLAATVVMLAASTAFAADVHDSNTVTEKTAAVKAEKAEVKTPVKKHNHMEEKTGNPVSEAPSGKSHRESMDKDMPMHDHLKEKH